MRLSRWKDQTFQKGSILIGKSLFFEKGTKNENSRVAFPDSVPIHHILAEGHSRGMTL